MRFTFSHRWTLGFIVLAAVFDVLSLFLPWGILASSSTYVYLPGGPAQGSEPLSVPDFLIILQARGQLITASNLIKAAIVLGWVGVVVYWFVERHLLSYGVVLASSCLSFIAVVEFPFTVIDLSWGAFLALVGGALMVLGIVLKELRMEVVVEREVSESKG
jgi:hypothetical protein